MLLIHRNREVIGAFALFWLCPPSKLISFGFAYFWKYVTTVIKQSRLICGSHICRVTTSKHPPQHIKHPFLTHHSISTEISSKETKGELQIGKAMKTNVSLKCLSLISGCLKPEPIHNVRLEKPLWTRFAICPRVNRGLKTRASPLESIRVMR